MQMFLMSITAMITGVIVGSCITYLVIKKFQTQKVAQEYKKKISNLEEMHQQEIDKLVHKYAEKSDRLHQTQKEELNRTIQQYETKIQNIQQNHHNSIQQARKTSTDASRSVIKGKIAEQLAPFLPNFNYLPSDARFIGNPIDYIVFNGYTNIKDSSSTEEELEIVILDVKTGKASLSKLQIAIANAIKAGRVRFETIRIEVEAKSSPQENNHLTRSTNNYIQESRKQYPRAYESWTYQEEEKLRSLYHRKLSIHEIASDLQRKPGAIRSRLKKLNLL